MIEMASILFVLNTALFDERTALILLSIFKNYLFPKHHQVLRNKNCHAIDIINIPVQNIKEQSRNSLSPCRTIDNVHFKKRFSQQTRGFFSATSRTDLRLYRSIVNGKCPL